MNTDPAAWARLGDAIQRARIAARLNQAELAERAGVSLASVQNAEAGRVPKLRAPTTLPKITEALGWAPDAADNILEGAPAPAPWRSTTPPRLSAERLEGVFTGAIVRAMDTATSAEIKAAVKDAVEALRREGLLDGDDDVQR